MSNLCLAQLRMQDHTVHITRNEETGCIVCFKYWGTLCDYEVFSGDSEDEIIEYIIQPIATERWVLNLE